MGDAWVEWIAGLCGVGASLAGVELAIVWLRHAALSDGGPE